MDFARNYSPPGVYIEESETSLATPTGVPPTLVAIAGPARGYQVNVEMVPLSGTTAVRLAKEGIDTGESFSVVQAGTKEPVANTEYTATADPVTGYVDLLKATGSTIPDGTAVLVTYRYTTADYYAPKRLSTYEDVKDLYGEPFNLAVATPGDPDHQWVLSPLSLAAKVAFENGAAEVYLCAAEAPGAEATSEALRSTARKDNLAAAYAKMAALPLVSTIVGITTGIAEADVAGALTDLANHVESATADGFMRFGIIGFDPTIATAPDNLLATSGAASKRLMLAYAAPSGLLMYSGAGNSSFAVGHQYLAAAYAGRMAALPVQQALTKQRLRSFTGLAGTPLSNALKNQYASAGVAVTEVDRNGTLVVRHGVTTDPTNVTTREAAVVRARDAMVVMLQDGMNDSGLIGQPIDEELLLSVKSSVQGVLEYAVGEEAIVSYTGLALRQISGDPSVVEVKFAYKPAYPLNYILISFSIDTSTGEINLAEAA